MNQFSIAYPTSMIATNIAFLVIIVLAVFSIYSFFVIIYRQKFEIRVNGKELSQTLFYKAFSSENKKNSFLYKDIENDRVFKISKKLFSLELKPESPYSLKSDIGLASKLKVNEPVSLFFSQEDRKVTVERIS